MLATLIIVFRELIEAGLIVGIVLTATRGVPHRGRWVLYGIGAGLLGAALVAAFAGTIGSAMHGLGQEYFNAGVLLVAVLMLTWHNVWMARHGRTIAREMKTVGCEVMCGKRSLLALAVVIAMAVLREGAEVVLFVYGIMVAGGSSSSEMLAGGAAGALLGMLLSVLMYKGLLKIPARHLFSVTSGLIALLAAGMAAQAVGFLQQAGTLDMLTQTAWDSSHILSEGSILGKTLHTLIGYMERPNLMQLLVYAGVLLGIFTLMRIFRVPHGSPQPAKTY